jgi:mannose-6-phosphate isomerase class I
VNIQAENGTVHLKKGETALMPAGLGDYTLSGDGTVLRSYMV